jgi:mannosyltransferase OCH1-like enzyme
MIRFLLLFVLIMIISTILSIKYTLKSPNLYDFSSTVPLNIFQTWHKKELPKKMQECVNSLKYDNPEFKFFLFDDNDCRNFIKQNFDNQVLYAFDTLIPGAYKADLWRYCVLYKLGGIYVDIKYKCVNGFKLISLMNEEHFVKDRFDVLNKIAVYNAFMICNPGNEIMLNCINKVVENVRNRYYGVDSLNITGPTMMIEFFSPNDKSKLNEMKHFDENINGNIKYYISYKETYILMIYPEYRREQLINQKKKHYSVLWQERNVYV